MHPLNLADASICKNGFTPSGTIGGLVKVLGPESRNALRDFKNANGLPKDDTWDAVVEGAFRNVNSVLAIDTPFGEWAANLTDCQSATARKLLVSSSWIGVTSESCELDTSLRRSGTSWIGAGVCRSNGRERPVRVDFSMQNHRLVDRSILGNTGLTTAYYERCR